MSVIFLLLSVSTLVAAVFLAGFIWAVRKGQYDDDHSPAVRILLDESVGDAAVRATRIGKGGAVGLSPLDKGDLVQGPHLPNPSLAIPAHQAAANEHP
jgi:cbb3-type cytochrome oxidase maturation protein